MSFDLEGNRLEVVNGRLVRRKPDAPQRRKRARAFDPNDVRTWHEVEDLTPRLKERLRLGGWIGWHVRKQGDHANWGDERRGARRAGIIETVPFDVAVLDWYCVPLDNSYWTEPKGTEHVQWIELKSEAGKLTEAQAETALRLARCGQAVSVLRPRHFIAPLGQPDLAFIRLVQHAFPEAWFEVLVQPEWDIRRVMQL